MNRAIEETATQLAKSLRYSTSGQPTHAIALSHGFLASDERTW
jgi:hypothetical protein